MRKIWRFGERSEKVNGRVKEREAESKFGRE